MKVRTGFCKFCGQAVAIETERDMDQEQLDTEATSKCTCEEAMRKRKQKESAGAAINAVEILFKELPGMEQFLKSGVQAISNGDVYSISVDSGRGTQAKLKMTNKGSIRVTRIEKEKRELE